MNRYRKFSDFLKARFGSPVYKLPLDAGFTCPNRDGRRSVGGCSFCNNHAFSPAAGHARLSLETQLEQGIARMKEGRRKAEKIMAYFQPFSNTYAPPEKLLEIFQLPLNYPEVISVAAGTRPDCLGPEVVPVLEAVAQKTHFWLEIGLESSHNLTLERINRGHSFEEFLEAYRRVRAIPNLWICLHLIQGLPGETEPMMLETLRRVNALKPHAVKFHQLEIVKDTPMEKQYRRGEIELLSLERHMEILGKSLALLDPEIVIQRLFGFTPSDYLVAPRYEAHRSRLQDFERYLEEKQIIQGAAHEV